MSYGSTNSNINRIAEVASEMGSLVVYGHVVYVGYNYQFLQV